MIFLGTSRCYFFPPTILLTLHEISLYFAITTQNTLKWIQISWALSLYFSLSLSFLSLSFSLSLFSLYMKFPYILTLITKNTLKWIKNILSFLSLLSIFYPIFSLSLSLSLSYFSFISPLFYLYFRKQSTHVAL